MNAYPLSRDLIVRIFFFAAFALILHQLFLLTQPFLTSILMATMLALGFHPFHQQTVKLLKGKNLAALFHLNAGEYRRLMDFLRRSNCLLDFRPYRNAAAQ